MSMRHDPIFVLDSGLGGLTVVRALLSRLPAERIVYFGDTARLPYGSKTKQTITHFVQQIIAWGLQFRPKHAVIACNTATALALPTIRQQFAPLRVTGVIDPGARAAAAAAGSEPKATVGIIATEATIRSEAYQVAIRKRRHHLRLLLRPTPLLVPMIEEGRGNSDPLVELCLKQYLQPMLDRKITALLLGCTHYPLLRRAIERRVGAGVAVIDSARQCAEDVAARLAASESCAAAQPSDALSADDRARLRCFVTDDAERFQRLAPRFLGFEIDAPTLVPTESLYRQPVVDEAVRLTA